MDVNIGKDIIITVDTTALPQTALDHVLYIGLRNILMDAHASATLEKHPVRDDMIAASRALAEKKLAALMSGVVRAAPTARTSDPVMARARKMALKPVNDAWRAKGRKPSDMTTEERTKFVDDYLAANPKVIETARAAIAAEAELPDAAFELPDIAPATDSPAQ